MNFGPNKFFMAIPLRPSHAIFRDGIVTLTDEATTVVDSDYSPHANYFAGYHGRSYYLFISNHSYGRGIIPPLLGWQHLLVYPASLGEQVIDAIEENFPMSDTAMAASYMVNRFGVFHVLNLSPEAVEAGMWATLRFERAVLRKSRRPVYSPETVEKI